MGEATCAPAGRPGGGRDRRGSGIGLATARRFASEGAHVVVGDVDPISGKAAAEEVGGLFVQVDVTSPEQVDGPVRRRRRDLRRARHRLQQRRHLPAGRRLDPDHRARRLAPRAGGEPDLGVPVLQGGDPAHAGPRPRLDHQHRVVRRADGRGDLADLLHRVQGRRAGDVAGARRAVRPRGHPGQRALPRAGEHPAAAGAVRQGPGAGRAPPGAHPDGPVRRARARSPPPSPSWPPTTRRSSPRRSSWSTAGSAGPTSRRSDRRTP